MPDELDDVARDPGFSASSYQLLRYCFSLAYTYSLRNLPYLEIYVAHNNMFAFFGVGVQLDSDQVPPKRNMEVNVNVLHYQIQVSRRRDTRFRKNI